MQRIFILVAIVATMLAITPFTAKYWPSSYLRSIVIIWLQHDEWKTLLELANNTTYTNITWVEDGILEVGTLEQNKIRWDHAPKIEKLIDAAKEYNIKVIDIVRYQEQWIIPGFGEIRIKDQDSESPLMVNISSYFQYGGNKSGNKCSDIDLKILNQGICHIDLYGNWILHKQWYSVAHIDDVNNVI